MDRMAYRTLRAQRQDAALVARVNDRITTVVQVRKTTRAAVWQRATFRVIFAGKAGK